MSDNHSCPRGIQVDVEHDHYISEPHDRDPADLIGATHWIGAGYKVIARCAKCQRHLNTRKYRATWADGELSIWEEIR